MAFLEIKNVRIAGISAGVPDTIVRNTDGHVQSDDYDAEAFVESTGVFERRFTNKLTTGDLCYAAAEKLIQDLSWDKAEIDGIIFVSQTHDYVEPATACILQDRLGLSKECYAEDLSMGCSGWVYGLSNAASLVSTGSFRKFILLAGEAKTKGVEDDPLFGHAGTATALEYDENAESLKFHFGTDGSGFDAIIIPDGGARNQFSMDSLKEEHIDGRLFNRTQTHMKGMDVFSFGISTAPKSIRKLGEHFDFNYQDCDYLLLHQANMKMNNFILKKLKFDVAKAPSCMDKFGNTSSASIPLIIVTKLREQNNAKLICCGFGVGLSWGTVALKLDNTHISELVEVSNALSNNKYVV